MSDDAKTMEAAAVPREVRAELAETLEEIGQAMGLLREASGDAAAGNVIGAKMSGSDALYLLSELEGKFSAMAAKLGRWSEAGEDDDLDEPLGMACQVDGEGCEGCQ